MTIIEDRLARIEELWLDKGSHGDFDDGMCVMEAVAWVAGEPWSDHPQCASPVIAAFMRTWNDNVDDDGRQALKPYVPRLVGSAGSQAVETRRGWMAADWMVHQWLPLWLRAAGLEDQAVRCEQLPEVTDRKTWIDRCSSTVREIREITWDRRRAWRDKLTEAVKEELAKRGITAAAAAAAVADAAADAAAAAAAAAVAVAAAAAAAVADAAAVAAAVAVAVAVAVADAAAAAAAVAVAAAVAAAAPYSKVWWAVRGAVYEKLKAFYRQLFEEKYPTQLASSKASALELVDRMLELGDEDVAA